MDNRPISTLDDRNARSWRVPNDPSPKAKSRTVPEGDGTPIRDAKTPSSSASKRTSKQSNLPPSNFSETASDAHTDAGSLKNKLRSRMWKLLFNNVDRSVDELYYFCEDENDHQKILDAVHKLRRCLTDFEKLVTRCEEQKRFEEGGQSVSWDVRKTSVGIRRSQIVTTEEFGPIDISGEVSNSAENSPTRKGKTYVDLKTPEAKSKLRALAKPFEPTKCVNLVATARVAAIEPVEPIDTDLSDKKNDKSTVSMADASAPMYRQECVPMDTSPSSSSKPDIREVTLVVGSPPRASNAGPSVIPPATAPAKSTAAVVASVSAKKPTVAIVTKPPAITTAKSFSTPPANRSNSKGGGRNTPSSLGGGKPGSDSRSKNAKKPTPTVGNARIRAASESRVTMKPKKMDEEDIVVTEEMVKATDAVWAEAEAWIEAEFIAEENAWKELERAPSMDSIGTNLTELKKKGSEEIRQQVSDELDMLHEEQAKRKISNADVATIAENSDESLLRYTTPPPHDTKVADQAVCSGNSPLQSKAGRVVNTQFLDGHSSAIASPAESNSNGHSPTHRYSSLHDKLSSPDRRKLTPAEARQRLDERLLIAESNRTKSVSEIKEKAMAQNTRVREVSQRTSERLIQAEQSYAAKLKGAEKRHDDYIKNIKDKAGNENTKVSEVLFINSFNEKVLKDELNARLTEVESRILAGRHRKEQLLQGIQDQRRKKNSRKAEQMSELRLNLERQKMERWEALQLRLKTVQERRQARMEELQRRSVVGAGEGNAESVDNVNTDSGELKTEVGLSCESNDKSTRVTPSLNVAEASDSAPMIDTLLTEPTHSKSKKKSKKVSSDLNNEFDGLDDDAVLELLAHAGKDNTSDSDTSDWKMQLVSSNLVSSLLESFSGTDVSRSKQILSLLSEAARLATTGTMDPFSLKSLEGISKNGKQTADAEEKDSFFVKLQAALSYANSSSKKKKKKKSKTTSVLPGDLKLSSVSATDASMFEAEHTEVSRPPSSDTSIVVVGRSCLEYQDGDFTGDMIDFIKRGLRIQDTTGLLLRSYSAVEVANTPNADTVRNFINSGGILVCVCALHRCSGVLHDERALRLGLDESVSKKKQEVQTSKKCSLALLAAQAIEWCARSDRKNCEKLSKSSELLECLIDLATILLQSFSSWHAEMEASVSRKNSKNSLLEHGTRTPGKDNSRTNTPQKGFTPARKTSSVEGGVAKSSVSGGDNGPTDNLPEYICILLPLLSTISSVLASLTDANAAVKLHGTDRSDIFADVTWVCYLLKSKLLLSANEALRDIDGYTDLLNGSTNIFHSIIYEVAGLIKEVSRVIRGVSAGLDVSHLGDTEKEMLVNSSAFAASYMHEEGNYVAANLVQVLSALLLRDLSTITHPASSDHVHMQRASAGADKGTGLSSIGSGWDKNQALPPPQVLWCSFRILEALNAVAMVDVLIVQSIPEVLKVSLVHTSALLLVVLFQIIEDRHWREKQSNDAKKNEKKKIVGKVKGRFEEPAKYTRVAGWCPETVGPAEATIGLCPLFVFLGYFCISSLENQAVVARGTPPSLLLRLCRMPIRYLTDERLKHQILPTLIAMCANNPTNMSVLHSELSPTLLTDYLSRLIDKERASSSRAIVTGAGSRSILTATGKADEFDPVKELKDRIPVSLWQTFVEQLVC